MRVFFRPKYIFLIKYTVLLDFNTTAMLYYQAGHRPALSIWILKVSNSRLIKRPRGMTPINNGANKMSVATWLIITGFICIAGSLFAGCAIRNGMNDKDRKHEN